MKNLFAFLLLILLISCSKEQEKEKAPQPETPQEHLVTGFIFKDVYGNPVGDKGNPNVKTNLQVNGKGLNLSAYPNPSQTEIAVTVHSTLPHSKKELWIVAAPQSPELAAYNFPQANQNLFGAQPIYRTEAANSYMQQSFIVDVSKFPAGAYRVYAKVDSTLLWDNILKN